MKEKHRNKDSLRKPFLVPSQPVLTLFGFMLLKNTNAKKSTFTSS